MGGYGIGKLVVKIMVIIMVLLIPVYADKLKIDWYIKDLAFNLCLYQKLIGVLI